jgi:phosphatidylglycerophosphate synthase
LYLCVVLHLQNYSKKQAHAQLTIHHFMSKLSASEKFIDVSDYGRPLARFFAKQLLNTRFTPVHVTLLFGFCGLCAIYCILNHFNLLAGVLLILKSIIDAADGELARMKNTPSYTGRYLDSIFDSILNFFFILAIASLTNASWGLILLTFICFQLQCTLYNYYYVILRNSSLGGDTTSKIFELETPVAFPGESQKTVDIMFFTFNVLYRVFDKTIHILDRQAAKIPFFPNWFMTMISFYGLGFQLLLMAILLALDLTNYILPFFVLYSVFIFIFIGIRRLFLK